MKTMKTLTTAGAIALAGALAVPTYAAAHGAVYETTAVVVTSTSPLTTAEQTRYVVANHGFTYVLRETNGLTSGGMFNYPAVPGGLRSQPGFNIFTHATPRSADTGAQPHATCDVASLNAEATIRSWQGNRDGTGDPFYNYVPFQRESAGLEDDPSNWIPVVKDKTGVDLASIADTDVARQTACSGIGGTYYPADEVQSSNSAFNSGLVAELTEPFEARIATLEEHLAAAEAAKVAADGRAATAVAQAAATEQQRSALAAQLAAVKPAEAVKPLAAKLGASKLTPRALAANGLKVTVTGPSGQALTVRATVSAAQAKRHKLRSTTLGSRRATLAADGTATVTVKPSAATARTLRAIKRGGLSVSVELVAASARATVSR